MAENTCGFPGVIYFTYNPTYPTYKWVILGADGLCEVRPFRPAGLSTVAAQPQPLLFRCSAAHRRQRCPNRPGCRGGRHDHGRFGGGGERSVGVMVEVGCGGEQSEMESNPLSERIITIGKLLECMEDGEGSCHSIIFF